MNYKAKINYKAVLSLVTAFLFTIGLSSQVLVKGSGIRYYQGYTIATYPSATAPATSVGTEVAYFIDLNIICKWDRANNIWVPVDNILVQTGVPAHTPGVGDPISYIDKSTGCFYTYSSSWSADTTSLLVSDSILVYSVCNQEIGRDTIRLASVSGVSRAELQDSTIAIRSDLGSGITDGDKGDIIVSGGGSNWSIDNNAVTSDEIASTTVTAGSYTNGDFTVDEDGRITTASNGTDNNGLIDSLPNGDVLINATGNNLLVENLDSMRIEGSKLEVEATTNFKSNVGYGINTPIRSLHIQGAEEQIRLESTGTGGTDNWLEMVNNSTDPLSANIIQFYKGGTANANKFASIGIPKNIGDSTLVIGLGNDIGFDNAHGYEFSMRSGKGVRMEPYSTLSHDTVSSGKPPTSYPAFDEDGNMITSLSPWGSGGGVANFTALVDAPSSYASQGNKLVIVKNDETGLEFIDTTGLFSGGSGGSSSAPEIGPEYPYDTIAYSKSYELDIDGTANFNGGARVYSSDSSSMMVTNGAGGSRGVEIIGFTHTGDTDYTVRLDIKNAGNGVRLLGQWSNPSVDITDPGVFYWDFTSPSGSGSFGKEIIILPFDSGPDTIYINSIYVYEKRSGYNILPKSEISSLITDSINTQVPLILNDSIPSKIVEKSFVIAANDYTVDASYTGCFACTGSVSNGFYQSTQTGSGQFVTFGVNEIDSFAYYLASIDIEIVDSSVIVQAAASVNAGSVNSYTITETGTYQLVMVKEDDSSSSFLDGMVFYCPNGGTIKLDKVVVTPLPTQNFNDLFVNIRNQEINIGLNSASSLPSSISIGENAEAVFDGQYGGAAGPNAIAIGDIAKAKAWRAIALGGFAGTTSSTAIGAGSTVLAIHGSALGRGAYVPHPDTVGFSVENVLGGSSTADFFFSNGWGHQFDTPEGGIGISNVVPSSYEIKLHGYDAFDAKDTPDDFNVDGGDIGIYSGRATGSGESGSINFYVAEGNNGANVKDTDILGMELRSDGTLTDGTHLYLRDESDNTLKRVTIDNAGFLSLGATSNSYNLTIASEESINFTAVAGTEVPVNSTSGAITATPPPSPTAGMTFAVFDSRGQAATNNITVDTSGDGLNGSAIDYVISTTRGYAQFRYVNATVGWRVIVGE